MEHLITSNLRHRLTLLPSAATAWDTTQWFVYLAPPIVHVLAAVGGIVMLVLGLRDFGELARAANGMLRRRQQGAGPGGSRLTGTIVIAEPARDPAWTRVAARVSAPVRSHQRILRLGLPPTGADRPRRATARVISGRLSL